MLKCKTCSKEFISPSQRGRKRRFCSTKCGAVYRYTLDYTGLTPQEKERKAKIQEHKCLICGVKTKLCVDHNPRTGQVRGLLCGLCNSGLGFLKDNATVLRAAADYVETNDA